MMRQLGAQELHHYALQHSDWALKEQISTLTQQIHHLRHRLQLLVAPNSKFSHLFNLMSISLLRSCQTVPPPNMPLQEAAIILKPPSSVHPPTILLTTAEKTLTSTPLQPLTKSLTHQQSRGNRKRRQSSLWPRRPLLQLLFPRTT